MNKTLRIIGAAFATIALLIVAFLWYDRVTYMKRVLGLDALPSSVEVTYSYSASWTDYYHEWIVSIEPEQAQELL